MSDSIAGLDARATFQPSAYFKPYTAACLIPTAVNISLLGARTRPISPATCHPFYLCCVVFTLKYRPAQPVLMQSKQRFVIFDYTNPKRHV